MKFCTTKFAFIWQFVLLGAFKNLTVTYGRKGIMGERELSHMSVCFIHPTQIPLCIMHFGGYVL